MQVGHSTQSYGSQVQIAAPERMPVGEQQGNDLSTVMPPVAEIEKADAQRVSIEQDNRPDQAAAQATSPERSAVDSSAVRTAASKDQAQAEEEQSREQAAAAAANEKAAEKDHEQAVAQQDKMIIDQLKARDREVRVHEEAHAAVGGQYAGSPSYTFQVGPDGRKYAVGGEVSISTSEVPNDPEATLRKADTIRAAALAPAQPSSQDQQVAAQALQMAMDAKIAIAAENREMAKAAAEQDHSTDEGAVRTSEESGDSVAVRSGEEPANGVALDGLSEEVDDENTDKDDTAADRFAEVYQQLANQEIQAYLLNSISEKNPTGGLLSELV